MDYGKIYIGRLKDASKLSIITDWKTCPTIPYTKYNIKETDFRVKTASFTSPQYLDLTTGQYGILIVSKYHENFSGIVLDVEYDEDTGLYTYQCQDWSRRYISKIEFVANKAKIYNLIRYLITNGGVSIDNPTKAQLKEYKPLLTGLKDVDLYNQSYYKGNLYAGNPLLQQISMIARDKTKIEIIRSLVFNSLGCFDVWFNDNGVLQITPLSKYDWERTGLILANGGYYGRKFKFSTTNAITNVAINGTDLTAGTKVSSKDALGLDLSAFFGNVSTSIADPNNKNTSNATKKTTTTKTTNKYGNPYNNKPKRIIVSEDRGGSSGFKSGIISKLKADGWSVRDLGTGPGTHSTSYNILSSYYSVNLTIYNGADPETIKEPVTGWLKGKHQKYGVQLVQMFDTKDWTNPHGMKPYRYGNFDGYTCHKAWDDNYSGKSDAQATISNLGAWYKQQYPKVIHCCGPSASEAYAQFKAGGYLKQKGLVK